MATRLILIGTGHVFQIQDAVRDAIRAIQPRVVFIELDAGRFRSLLNRRRGVVEEVRGNWLHRRLQRFQEGIAEAYGAEAGGEMLAAAEGAQMVGAETHLVDRRVDVTLRRVLKQLSWTERLRAVSVMAGSAFKGLLPRRRSAKEEVDAEIRKYNENPDEAIIQLGRQFPTVRRVVIDERDDFMAARIKAGLDGVCVAVVGDGHIPGLIKRLDDVELEVYRLQDVQAGRLPKVEDLDTRSVHFGHDVEV